MQLGPAVPITVIEERPDGRGGLVEIPIITETPFIDFSQTAGGGPKKGAITADMLAQMAANFPRTPGTVTVGTMDHDRDTSGPQPGFIDSVRFDGTTLWAVHDLGPDLFDTVVRQRAFRGYSIEAKPNKKFPTVTLEGWVLEGGIFTNDPATDVHFALSRGHEPHTSIRLALKAEKGEPMPDSPDLAQLRAENKTQRDEIADLKAKLTKAEKLAKDSGARNDELAQSVETLQGDVAKLTQQIGTQTTRDTKQRVLAVREIACKRKGIAPAFFEGMEEDPVAWLDKRNYTIEGLENMFESLDDKDPETPISSGDPSASSDAETKFELALKAVQKEHPKMPFEEQVALVRSQDPDLYRAGLAGLQISGD